MFPQRDAFSTFFPRVGAAIAGLAAAVWLVGASPALPEAASDSVSRPTLDIGDEPGRISTEEVVIKDGPYRRQLVFFRTNEAPGTIVIHTAERFLYLVLGNNRALRYGIGVGRQGFQWSGLVRISKKAEWPDWTPPPEMIKRQPYLPRFMAGGPGNPLGARALYLGATDYRIHGTNQPETIGQSISSGCFRLANGDVVDLYARAEVGTKVIIQQAAAL
jgi:lipoprotein-anchoring transpeptidase ErfK/SrfK